MGSHDLCLCRCLASQCQLKSCKIEATFKVSLEGHVNLNWQLSLYTDTDGLCLSTGGQV